MRRRKIHVCFDILQEITYFSFLLLEWRKAAPTLVDQSALALFSLFRILRRLLSVLPPGGGASHADFLHTSPSFD